MKHIDNTNVCLTTFVYGETYQNYIPLLIYSIQKAYPEYFTIIFIHKTLNGNIKEQLKLLNQNQFLIIENCFDEFDMTPSKSMALRWVLWHDKFKEIEYLYIVDIDMLYIAEPIPLHLQHIQHMNFIGLPFSNILRKRKIYSLNLFQIIYRIKKAGLYGFTKFISSNLKYEYLLSGLHFIKIKDYYNLVTSELLIHYKKQIYSNEYYKFTSITGNPSTEALLYLMLQKAGFEINKLGLQTDSIKMLDFNNPERTEFRPHHGLHMGIFRVENIDKNSLLILNSETYKYYIEKFKSDIITDPLFFQIIENLGNEITTKIDKLTKFYEIEIDSKQFKNCQNE
jgi:hypothetical protein